MDREVCGRVILSAHSAVCVQYPTSKYRLYRDSHLRGSTPDNRTHHTHTHITLLAEFLSELGATLLRTAWEQQMLMAGSRHLAHREVRPNL